MQESISVTNQMQVIFLNCNHFNIFQATLRMSFKKLIRNCPTILCSGEFLFWIFQLKGRQVNVSQKKAKPVKKWNWVPATNLSPSNFMKIKTSSQVGSKNSAKILIYLSVYISLQLEIVVSKISNKSQGIN